jgi:enoyl-CoA hydratase/carnithine racemase
MSPLSAIGSAAKMDAAADRKRAMISMIAISDILRVRKDVPSGTIILNCPDRRNALTSELVAMIQQALDDFMQERSVRAVILTGTGNTFCSGTDLHQIQQTGNADDALKVWQIQVQEFQDLIESMLRFPKPIIAAVNGWVVGTGLALLLASDVVVASHEAHLLMPESLRGLNPGITAPLLVFRVGAARASRILFAPEPFDAVAGAEFGLFHECVADHLVWARAQQFAAGVAQGARESFQLTKQMLNETIGEHLFTQLSIGAAHMAAARTTDAAREGIAAFLEKRTPVW